MSGYAPSIFAACTLLVTACASSSAPPVPVAREAPVAAPSPAVTAAASPAPSVEEAYDDPGELRDPEMHDAALHQDDAAVLSEGDRDRSRMLAGHEPLGRGKKDYDALVASCGAPTGSVQYVAPASGKLHHVHDKRDTFIVKIQGGLCYRFFGVADGTIQDLDILIERANGDLVGDDKTNGPVAIIDSDKNWCMDNDGDFRFKVEVDGPGTGNYEFGVWARPKK